MSRRAKTAILAVLILVTSTLACIKIDPDVGPDPLPTPVPTQPPADESAKPVLVDVSVRYYEKVPTAFYHLLGKTAKQQHFETFTLVNRGEGAVTVKVVSLATV